MPFDNTTTVEMTQRERLEYARDMIQRVNPEKLNMNTWVYDCRAPYDCNTAACFAGWCARDPVFRRQGFEIEMSRQIEIFPVYKGYVGFFPVYKEHFGYAAVREFFGLTDEQCEYLTNPNRYPRRMTSATQIDMVVRRIDELLKLMAT